MFTICEGGSPELHKTLDEWKIMKIVAKFMSEIRNECVELSINVCEKQLSELYLIREK